MKDFFDWVNHHSTPEWMSLVVIFTMVSTAVVLLIVWVVLFIHFESGLIFAAPFLAMYFLVYSEYKGRDK